MIFRKPKNPREAVFTVVFWVAFIGVMALGYVKVQAQWRKFQKNEQREAVYWHKVRRISYWDAAIEKAPVADRVQRATPDVLDYILKDNELQGFTTATAAIDPTDAERKTIADAVAALPEAVRRLAEERLMGVFAVKDLGTTGLTETVMTPVEEGYYAFIVLDLDVIRRRKVNDWATWKENSAFRPSDGGGALTLTLEEAGGDTELNALRYIFLHELGHVLDMASRATTLWRHDTVKDLVDYPFLAMSWSEVANGANMSRFDYDFPERLRLDYYRFESARLSSEYIFDVVRDLGKTNFATLYGSTLHREDFAESFVTFQHCVNDKRPWKLMAVDVRGSVEINCPWSEERMGKKRQFMEQWFAGPAAKLAKK